MRHFDDVIMTSRRETQMGDQVIFISYPLVWFGIGHHKSASNLQGIPDRPWLWCTLATLRDILLLCRKNCSWFLCFCCPHLLTFFKKISFRNSMSVKQFGSRSGPRKCRSWSGSKLFAKVISRQQKPPLDRKELTRPMVSTKISCAGSFLHFRLARVASV